MKLLFYHAIDSEPHTNSIFLGLASLYLKTFIDINDPELSSTLTWLLPQQRILPDQELIDLIEKNDVDILCTSHYIWNNHLLLNQIQNIKTKINKKIIIISGGPSVSVNVDKDFLKNNPNIDYAVYGAGEQAFYDVLKSVINKTKLISFNTSNIAWYDHTKEKQIVAEYKYVPIPSTSHYLHNANFLKDMVEQEQRSGYNVAIPYELTRGCPYSCTFCDWNSGLSNKVSRRKNTYKDEIDLFAKLGIKVIYLSDANVGQYDEDIDMISYFVEKNIKEKIGFKLMGNFSKLKKKNNLKIFHLMASGDLLVKGFNLSVQDINPEVLKNIDRPDITWDEHVKIINELNESYPHTYSKVQLIQGLPGQTVISWRQTLSTIARKKILPIIFLNELLPASPASLNKSYQEKFKFKYSTCTRFSTRTMSTYFTGTFPESCASFSREDLVEMTMLTGIYSSLATFKLSLDYHELDVDTIAESFLQSQLYTKLKNNLLTNWKNGKYYYTLGFDDKEETVSACAPLEVIHNWVVSQNFMQLVLKHISDTNLKKKVFLHYKDKVINNLVVEIINDYS